MQIFQWLNMLLIFIQYYTVLGFPSGSAVKNLPTMQEMEVWSLGQEDPLEKEMAAHFSILAWEIPWTEKPGGLQSVGLQRVKHNFMNEHKAHTHHMCIYTHKYILWRRKWQPTSVFLPEQRVKHDCMYTYSFSDFFIIGYYRLLNIVPCAIY